MKLEKLLFVTLLAFFIACENGNAQTTGNGKLPDSSMPIVGIAKGTDYAAVTAGAITNAGGLNSIVKRGDTVLIKPNLCLPWFETPLATDYRVVAEVVRQVKILGAGRIIVAEGAFDPDPFSSANQRVSRKEPCRNNLTFWSSYFLIA